MHATVRRLPGAGNFPAAAGNWLAGRTWRTGARRRTIVAVEKQYIFFDTRRGCRIGLLIGILFTLLACALAALVPGPGWLRLLAVLALGALFVPFGWWLEHRRDSARRR
jgi:hypothetical protein